MAKTLSKHSEKKRTNTSRNRTGRQERREKEKKKKKKRKNLRRLLQESIGFSKRKKKRGQFK
jgi:hypothetical protein